jgi:hypothetical protein
MLCKSNIKLTHVSVSPRPHESLPIGHLKVSKLCPLPVSSFTGRMEILNQMCQYFDSDQKSQKIFVLHGLGGSGKSQLAFKFIEDSQSNQQYDFTNRSQI